MKQKGKHPANALSAVWIKKKHIDAGFYADGNGLYLKVDKSGARRWIQRLVIHGKRKDMGLGSASLVSLSDAREQARINRALARSGGDPLAEKRKEQPQTFKESAYAVYEINKPSWKNEKHAKQWITTLEKSAFPVIGDKLISQIDTPDILEVLQPIWITKHETARRIKQRMSSVFKWSQAKQWRSNDPTDNIEKALPKHSKPVKHHLSLPFNEVARAIETVNNSNALPITKLTFEFLVLTACRSGDVRGMRWDEIEGDKWVIPASRMKKGKEHRIPLPKRCMEIISIAETMKDGTGLVFPNNGKPLSDMTLSKLMKELGIKAVPHGFRTSFRQWTTEKTNYPWQVCEFALAHVVGDEAEQAYQRSDLFDTRINMMEAWAQYVINQRADVIPLVKNNT